MFAPDDKTAEYITEATMECGCQIIRESEVGEVQGITFCPTHNAGPKLLAALECFLEAFGPFEERALPNGLGPYWSPAGIMITTEVADQARDAIAAAR